MKKKLIAVAVAGALGAPAVALAQASTVQIYGTLILNYNYVDQGDSGTGAARTGRPNIDMFNAHDSNIGFKGEEALGGGLSAWFQCESTVDVSGNAAAYADTFWCGRNSALGFKGGFGNVYAGIWDTPLKMIASPLRPFSTSGAYGMGSLLWNESGSNVGNGATGPAGTGSERASFTRRQNSTLNYWTPNFSGFQAGFAWSALNEATDVTNLNIIQKPRLWSLGASYTNGPLYIGAGYERHDDYNPGNVTVGNAAGQYNGGRDTGWNLGIAYTFMGRVKVSAIYTSQQYDTAIGQSLDHDAWGLYLDWSIQGPHRIRAGYTRASDVGGNSTVAVNQYQAPVVVVGGAAIGRGDTGGQHMAIQYAYGFSKRTEVNFGYAKVDNDSNARYRLQTLTDAPTAGTNQSSWTLGIKHTF